MFVLYPSSIKKEYYETEIYQLEDNGYHPFDEKESYHILGSVGSRKKYNCKAFAHQVQLPGVLGFGNLKGSTRTGAARQGLLFLLN